jgi:hypothetical protein
MDGEKRKKCVPQTTLKLNKLPSVKHNDLFMISVQTILFIGQGKWDGKGPKKIRTLKTEGYKYSL